MIFEDKGLWKAVLENNLAEALLIIDHIRIATIVMIKRLGIEDRDSQIYQDDYGVRINTVKQVCVLLFEVFVIDNNFILPQFKKPRTIFCVLGLLEALSRHNPSSAGCLAQTNDEGRTFLHQVLKNKGDMTNEELFSLIALILKINQRALWTNIIDTKDKDGNTPLIIAVKQGLLSVVVLLLSYGAEVDEINNKGKTVLDYININSKLKKEDKKILKYLLEEYEPQTGSQIKRAKRKEKVENLKKNTADKIHDIYKKLKFLRELISNPSEAVKEAFCHIWNNSDLILHQIRSQD